jgi:hypothetical protein
LRLGAEELTAENAESAERRGAFKFEPFSSLCALCVLRGEFFHKPLD